MNLHVISILAFITIFAFGASIGGPTDQKQTGRMPASADIFGYQELKNLIESRQLTKPEDVIAALPPAMLRNYTLMHSSLSLQGASPMNPRAILFQPSGNLIVTFNGEPSQKGYHALEVANFDPNTSTISFHEIAFDPKGRTTPKFSEANPAKCRACHGKEGSPRYIWSAYDNWDGAYGQVDDRILEKDDTSVANLFTRFLPNEKESFLKFREAAKSHPRYRHLQRETASHPYFPYNNTADKKARGVAVLPNARLAWLMVTNFADSLAQQISQRPTFKSARYSLLYASLCHAGDPKLMTQAKNRVHLFSSSEFPAWNSRPFKNDVQNLMVGNLTSFSTFELNPSEPTGRQFNYTTGSLHIDHVLSALLLKRVIEQDKEFGKQVSFDEVFLDRYAYGSDAERAIYQDAGFPDDVTAFQKHQMVGRMFAQAGPSHVQGCDQIEKSVRQELNQPFPIAQSKVQQPLETAKLTGPEILNQYGCVSCHSSEAFDVGPPIPFNDQNLLRQIVASNKASSGLNFSKEIAYRTAHKKAARPGERKSDAQIRNDHMPRGGGYLPEKHRATLIKYIQSLEK